MKAKTDVQSVKRNEIKEACRAVLGACFHKNNPGRLAALGAHAALAAVAGVEKIEIK